jgi:hypothetical protein
VQTQDQEPDFVSLVNIMDAIARCVSIPPTIDNVVDDNDVIGWEEVEAWADTETVEQITRKSIPPFREFLYRHSTAADELVQKLGTSPIDQRPAWLDIRQGMGRPRRSIDAEIQGMRQLYDWAEIFPAWVRNCRARAWSARSNRHHIRQPELAFVNVSNLELVQGIGFGRADLARFLDRSGVSHLLQGESKPGLPTPDVAAAFAGLGEWNEDQWAKNLPQAAWAKDACVREGRRGKNGAAQWDPVRLAQLATAPREITLDEWGRIFRMKDALKPWLAEWEKYESHERWYGGKNPVIKPLKRPVS